ncbi:hypothetical protein EII28_00440 [Fusobacterium nucleatum]|uniref:Uncharacterized protein n=1 Tax=Fusobacterium nucleatum TaxID=851 RepID=A0A3P1VW04_FUSNU|nr:hypothetical protein [Fusobacterium nucleatum]RRD38552.1 hypothetical protein EII28_00440 [Fusobacterium nucleatum]
MKKIFILFFVIFSSYIFGKNIRNLENKLIFYGEIENSNKVIAIYQEDKKIIYTCGVKDKKPEIIVFGTAGKNIFKNVKQVDLDDVIIQKGIDYFIQFKDKEYIYLLLFSNGMGVEESYYDITIFKNEKPICNEVLKMDTIIDLLFTKSIFYNLPDDDSSFAESYIYYD